MEGTFKAEAMRPEFIHKKYHPYFQCVMDITQPKTEGRPDGTILHRYFKLWKLEHDKKNMKLETLEKCIQAVYGSNEYELKKFENLEF
jgi:hypothetical protein